MKPAKKMKDGKLLLNLILNSHERSKDINGSTTELTIENRKIIFKKEFYGFKAAKGKHFKKKISPEEEEIIIEQLKKLSLNQNISETKDTDSIGIEKKLNIEISKPFTCVIHIVGKSNIWGTDDFVLKEWGKKYIESRTNIENIEIISNAESLISFINILHNL